MPRDRSLQKWTDREVDGQKVEQHSLADQIAADEYLASKKAVKSRTSGLKITKLCHSGA